MSRAFALQVPSGPRFHALAGDIAGRYVELQGGSTADAAALATLLVDAVARLAVDAGTAIDVIVDREPSALEITVRAGARSSTVTFSLPGARI